MAKVFSDCELAKEINTKHGVSSEDVPLHLCVANRDTSSVSHHQMGIYAISSLYWCGKNSAGGSCNIRCSDLINDDITHDVICAKKILRQQGTEAWKGENKDSCLRRFSTISSTCLGVFTTMTNSPIASPSTFQTHGMWNFSTQSMPGMPTQGMWNIPAVQTPATPIAPMYPTYPFYPFPG